MTPTANSCSALSHITPSTYWMAITKACQLQNTKTQICYVELLLNNLWWYCFTSYDDISVQCSESMDINTCFWSLLTHYLHTQHIRQLQPAHHTFEDLLITVEYTTIMCLWLWTLNDIISDNLRIRVSIPRFPGARKSRSFSSPENSGMDLPHSRRKWEPYSWWLCCHLPSYPHVLETRHCYFIFIDGSLLDAVTLQLDGVLL